LNGHRTGQISHMAKMLGFKKTQRSEGTHELRAVDQCQALFGSEANGLKAGFFQRFRAIHFFSAVARPAFADQDKCKMRQGSKISAGSHASLLGNDGTDPSIEK